MSPHLTQIGLTLHGSVLGVVATTKKPSSSSYGFLVIIGIVVVLYLLVLRPQSQKRKRALQQGQQVAVGDEVMLSSGIIGRITELEGDRASVEIAPDIEIEVIRRAIAQRLTPAETEDTSTVVPPDPGLDGDDDFAHASDDDVDAPLDSVESAPGVVRVSPADDDDSTESSESGLNGAGIDSADGSEPATTKDSKDSDGWSGGRLP